MELNAPGWPRRIQVHAIWSRQRGLGQAGNWLRDIFSGACAVGLKRNLKRSDHGQAQWLRYRA